MNDLTEQFWHRLCTVCQTDEVSEIAEKLGIGYMTVRNYKNGRVPNADILITIAQKTSANLNWLLTGQGEPFISEASQDQEHASDLPLAIDSGSVFELELPPTRLRLRLVTTGRSSRSERPTDQASESNQVTIPLVKMIDELENLPITERQEVTSRLLHSLVMDSEEHKPN